MAKQLQNSKWYRLDKLDRFGTSYKVVIGERSNGKTYSVKERCIDKYSVDKSQFLYLRRSKTQVTRKNMVKLFEDISDYAEDVLGDYIHYTPDSGFYITDGESEERQIMGYARSIDKSVDLKGVPLNKVKTIFFDEFLERTGTFIDDEITNFLNVISTVVRKRDDVEIIMIANTVTKYSPYFTLMGIDPTKLKQGKISVIKHLNGASVAVEYCRSSNIVDGNKLTNKYIGFDNSPTSNMILYGEWEYDVVNTKAIDGIGWSCKRLLIPIYITALGEVYELSLYEGDNPIAFARKINTQNGVVRKDVLFNLTYDNSLVLQDYSGKIVPTYGKLSPLMGDYVNEIMKIFMLCIDCKRVVYDTIESGSDFTNIFKEIRK